MGAGSAIRNTQNVAVEISSATLRLSEMGRPLFNGLNLSIKKGEKVAIVGRTGSGKTSLVKMIVGLLKPEAGSVMINGSDIGNIHVLICSEQSGQYSKSHGYLQGH